MRRHCVDQFTLEKDRWARQVRLGRPRNLTTRLVSARRAPTARRPVLTHNVEARADEYRIGVARSNHADSHGYCSRVTTLPRLALGPVTKTACTRTLTIRRIIRSMAMTRRCAKAELW